MLETIVKEGKRLVQKRNTAESYMPKVDRNIFKHTKDNYIHLDTMDKKYVERWFTVINECIFNAYSNRLKEIQGRVVTCECGDTFQLIGTDLTKTGVLIRYYKCYSCDDMTIIHEDKEVSYE